jgi:hypothetical protein
MPTRYLNFSNQTCTIHPFISRRLSGFDQFEWDYTTGPLQLRFLMVCCGSGSEATPNTTHSSRSNSIRPSRDLLSHLKNETGPLIKYRGAAQPGPYFAQGAIKPETGSLPRRQEIYDTGTLTVFLKIGIGWKAGSWLPLDDSASIRWRKDGGPLTGA